MFRRSQTKSDNTNADGKRRETRDYSPWTSLQMGKIWSQVQGACKNVVKLVAATSVGRIARDASKSKRSPRSPVEVANATNVECSSSCAGEVCGATCRKNLMRSRGKEKSKAAQACEECAEKRAGECREYTEVSMRKNPRAIKSSSRHDAREHVCQNAEEEKNEKPCVFCSGAINSNQSSTRLPVALTEPSKFIAYV